MIEIPDVPEYSLVVIADGRQIKMLSIGIQEVWMLNVIGFMCQCIGAFLCPFYTVQRNAWMHFKYS